MYTYTRSEQSSLALCLMRSRHAIVCAASAFAYTHSVAAPTGSAINASNLRCVGVSYSLALPLSLSLTLIHSCSLCSAVRALHAFLHFAARLHKFRARHLSLPSRLHVLHAQVQRLVTLTSQSQSTSHCAMRSVIAG